MNRTAVTTNSEEETIALAERLGRSLRAGDVVALEGELGAGKTRFVQGIARGLGLLDARVNSPTFVLVNIYSRGEQREPPHALVHVDAYRLSGADDLPALGWDRFVDGSNVIAVEWAGRILSALPEGRYCVSIEHAGENQRRILIDAPPGRTFNAVSACRVCGGVVPSSRGASVFCSDRCKMADLGKWFSGDYTISRPLTERDLESD